MSSDAKRKNHYTKKKLEKALHFANVLKINEEKCALIARLFVYETHDYTTMLYHTQRNFEIQDVCLTLGSQGLIY
ncbi:hypothetical protein HHE014_06240 [Helicobacter heilmannii]|nr:hypothetical protein HHE014_06240 [Helicobacter heilmannii]